MALTETETLAEFRRLFQGLASIGRDPRGGWTRHAWTAEGDAANDWFAVEAAALGMAVEVDRNANMWARWPPPGAPSVGVVATGSHLDTVTNGGAYDGALGIVSAFLAVRVLKGRGFRPQVPLAVVAFCDEEGAASGLATLGSRLTTGALDPERARRHLADPGPDPERLAALAAYVELHVEQGRGLADLDAPLAVGVGIWPHGRWRFTLTGEANHAGTTRLVDRRDPMLGLAAMVQAARRAATACGAVATVGRVEVDPGVTNAVPGAVAAWLDARAADERTLDRVLAWVSEDAAGEPGITCDVVEESRSLAVTFDGPLSDRVAAVLGDPPRLPTAAGHDAGALAAVVPSAMIFIRNPNGTSHSPAESASDADCVTGAIALADVLASLAG